MNGLRVGDERPALPSSAVYPSTLLRANGFYPTPLSLFRLCRARRSTLALAPFVLSTLPPFVLSLSKHEPNQ